MVRVVKLWRVDVQVSATAYVKAPTPREALEKVAELNGQGQVVSGDPRGVPIVGCRFSDPAMPELSLSPAITIHGVCPGSNPEEVDCNA